MRSIRHEAALLLKRSIEPRQQRVDDAGKPAQLVALIRDRQPLMQVSCADARRRRAHSYHWRETLAGKKVAANRGQQKRQRHCDKECKARGLEQVFLVVERAQHNQRVPSSA